MRSADLVEGTAGTSGRVSIAAAWTAAIAPDSSSGSWSLFTSAPRCHGQPGRGPCQRPSSRCRDRPERRPGGRPGPIDAVVANPPYLADPHHRVYRDTGGALGFDLSVRIAREALDRLDPGGQLILYTGSPVVAGEHPLRDALAPHLAAARCRHTWEELDPDVFGEELDEPAYGEVERIAAIGVAVLMT